MLVSHLLAYGVPAVIVERWRKRMGEELLPLQEEAVIKRGLLQGRSLLIEAPTSAGKTFCAEIAAAAAIFKRRKVLMLVPLKAIAAERFADFHQKYGSLGIRVVVSSSDHHQDDHKIRRGEFDLAILIYEKFSQLLISNHGLLESVDLVIIDELQMLADRQRGATLELAMTKLLIDSVEPQILALTTSIPNREQVAAWLGCEVLSSRSRPTELRQGVLQGCSLKSLNFNDKNQVEEELLRSEPYESEERLLQTTEALADSGDQVLVFVRSKRAAECLAGRLAASRGLCNATEFLKALADQPDSLLRDKLLLFAGGKVAFHHSDLSQGLRAEVERAFRERDLQVVFATTTLAFGVNLPADSVILDAYKFDAGAEPGRTTVVPLNWREYEAMSGRAGRYGHCRDVGRAMLLADSEVEAESFWRLYVAGSAVPLASQLQTEPLSDIVLDLCTAKLVHCERSLKEALQSTLAAVQGVVWENELIEQAVLRLQDLKLVEAGGGLLSATALGEACKRQGLSVAAVKRLMRFLEDEDTLDKLSWLAAVMTLPEATQLPIYLTYQEEQGRRWRRELIAWLSHSESGTEERPAEWLAGLAAQEHILSRDEQRHLKAAFALLDWCNGKETIQIEQKYGTHLGAVLHCAATASWLLNATAELARILNCSEGLGRLLKSLAGEVSRGHPFSDSIVAEVFTDAEERDLVMRLITAGFCSSREILAAPSSQLSELIGLSQTNRLKGSLKQLLEQSSSADAGKEVEMPLLRLRGSLEGDRVPIRYANEEIDLTPKSFSYLFKLSAWRLLRADGWVSKDEIEPGFNQAKNIYRVKQELKRFATGLEKLIENNKSGCYRINLEPEQIRIDHDSMESFCDMELLNLSRRLQQRLAS